MKRLYDKNELTFASENLGLQSGLVSAAFLCVVSVGYGLYLAKKFPLAELQEKL